MSVNGAERDRVRAEIHLAVAVTDRERRTVARADHQIVFAGEDEAERKRAAQLRQRRPHRLDRLDALLQHVVDQMQHDLGVGLRLEDRALLLERFAQLAEILDDAVMDHGDAFGRVRMGVVLGRLAVGGPAGVADAGVTVERRIVQPLLEILQLAFGAPPLELACLPASRRRRNRSRDIRAASGNRPVAPRRERAPECRQCRTCGMIPQFEPISSNAHAFPNGNLNAKGTQELLRIATVVKPQA